MGRQDVLELGRGALAERGQAHAPAVAREQRLAELLLEAPDVPADRGLRQVQRLGRAVVAAVADDRLQRAEVGGVEVHRVSVARGRRLGKRPITKRYRSRRRCD